MNSPENVQALNAPETDLRPKRNGLKPLRNVFRFFGELISKLLLVLITILALITHSTFTLDGLQERARESSENLLAFLFPDFIGSIGSVELNFDPTENGFVEVGEIFLFDPHNERTIIVDKLNFSPSLRSLVTGKGRLNALSVSGAQVLYRNSEIQGSKRLVFPINILDIPTSLLVSGGAFRIDDMQIVLTQFSGEEIFSLRELSANLKKTAEGYEGRLNARDSDDAAGAFSFRSQRIHDQIYWQADGRNYKVTTGSDILANFKLDLRFDDIPPYDLTEKSDNVSSPQDFLTKGSGFVRASGKDWNASGNFDFDPDLRALILDDMRFDSENYQFDGEVEASIKGDGIIHGRKMRFYYPTQSGFAEIEDVGFMAKLDPAKRSFQLGEIWTGSDLFGLAASGRVSYQDSLNSQFVITADDVNISDAYSYWPKAFGEKIYDWSQKNLHDGVLKDLRIDFSSGSKLGFELRAFGEDIRLTAVKGVPDLRIAHSALRMNAESFLVQAEAAKFADETLADAKFSELEFWLSDLTQKPIVAEVQFGFSGGARTLVNSLSNDPIRLAQKIKLDANTFSGNLTGKFSSKLPLKKDFKWQDIEAINLTAKAQKLGIDDIAQGHDYVANTADLLMSKDRVEVKTQGQFGGVDADVEMSVPLRAGATPQIDVTGQTTLAALSSIGLKLPGFIGGNQVGYALKLAQNGSTTSLEGKANIADLSVAMPLYGEVKKRGVAGVAEFDVVMAPERVDVRKLNINAGSLRTNGEMRLQNGRLASATFRNAKIGNQFDGNLSVDANGNLTIFDGFADLTSLNTSGAKGGSSQNITIKNMRAKLPLDIDLRQINGSLQTGQAIVGNLSGKLRGRTPISIKISPFGKETLAHITSNDGADAIRDAGLFSGLRHGKLDFKIRTTPTKGLYAGKFKLTRTEIGNSVVAVQLLKAASIFGVIDPNGVFFSEVGGDLLLYPDRLELYSGHAFGSALGLTLGGEYDYRNKRANFAGVLTPAFLLNGLLQDLPLFGELLTGNVGEGVLGVTFQVKGPVNDYDIYANPLSLLTPGKLRDIWTVIPQARTIPESYRIQ